MTRVIHYNPFAVRVTFTPDEVAAIHTEAARRQTHKDANRESAGMVDKSITGRDKTDTHHIGLMGEAAVGRLLYLKPDMALLFAGDRVKDFTLYGITLEVKTLRGFLAFKKLEDFVSDIGVLCIHNPNDLSAISVQGWITKQEFRDNHFIDDFGYGPRPCMQPAALLPIHSLREYCLSVRNLRYLNNQIARMATLGVTA